ncbi:hypothetical protein B0H34DRAFT_651301 [Crassisporium funariophilum]|nr:hypothetical protein B0H34DRAFT_651301 [Crassisporium funariophilum]
MFESESQETLVNVEPRTELVFTTSSVMNTSLLFHHRPTLNIATKDAAGALTLITDLQTNELLVTIKRRTLHPDTVKFAYRYDGKAVKIKDWMQEGKMEDGRLKWTMNTPVGRFVWRKDVALRLALWAENDGLHPIAWSQLKTEYVPHALVLERGTEIFRDEIVASYLILEQQMRIEEKGYHRYRRVSRYN